MPVNIWVIVTVIGLLAALLGSLAATWVTRRNAKDAMSSQKLQRSDDKGHNRKLHSWTLVKDCLELATSKDPVKSSAGVAQLTALKLGSGLDKEHRALVVAALDAITAAAVQRMSGPP